MCIQMITDFQLTNVYFRESYILLSIHDVTTLPRDYNMVQARNHRIGIEMNPERIATF